MVETTSLGIGVAFLAGLLSFLSPCVLPLWPSYMGFLTGLSVEELEAADHDARRIALIHAVLFVGGFSLVFVAMGASASLVGELLRSHRDWIARLGGAVVILFGVHLLGLVPLDLLSRERRYHFQRKPVGYAGTALVGLAFGAGWTPCIGPILGGILTLAATSGGVAEGAGLLAVYSAGLAVPFLLSAAALSRFLGAYRRFRRYVPWVERASGALLVLVGVLLVSGQFTVLAGWAARFTPEFILQNI